MNVRITNNQLTIDDLRNIVVNLDGRSGRISSVTLFTTNDESNELMMLLSQVDIIKLPFCYGRYIQRKLETVDDNTSSITLEFFIINWIK